MLTGEHCAMGWPDVRLLSMWTSSMPNVVSPAGVWSQDRCSRPCLSSSLTELGMESLSRPASLSPCVRWQVL